MIQHTLFSTLQLEFQIEDLLNQLRSQDVAKQYTVSQRDGLQRNPPLKIDNKDERPTVLLTFFKQLKTYCMGEEAKMGGRGGE